MLSYAISLGRDFVLALIVDALAPYVRRREEFRPVAEARRLFVHGGLGRPGSSTCCRSWAASSGCSPPIYSLYTFYLGAPVLKKCPADKAVVYTIVIVLCGLVLGAVLGGALMPAIVGGGMMAVRQHDARARA